MTHGELRYKDGQFGISAEPHVMIRLKRIFPRANQTVKGVLIVSETDETATDLEWILQRWPLEMAPETYVRVRDGAERHRAVAEQMDRILHHGDRLDDTGMRPMGRPPRWPHQASNADVITTMQRVLITDGLGRGKTYSGNTAFRNPGALPGLVVVQAHLGGQWKDQLALDWPDLVTHIVRTGSPYDAARYENVTPDVYICTYSKLAGWVDYFRGRIRTVVFDEAQELRNGADPYTGPLKCRVAKQIADQADYVVGLTNTPVYNYGGEIHNVLDIVRPGVLGDRPEFLREWCGVSESGKSIVSDPKALGTHLRELGVMVGTESEQEPPVPIPYLVDSDPKVFDAMKGDAAELARFILSSEGTGLERMQASSELDWRLREATGLAKAPFVVKWVDMLLQQVDRLILFGWHRAVYNVWMEGLAAHRPVMYTGSESPAAKERNKQRFLSDGPDRAKVLVMSLRSGAGIDGLQEKCHTVVFGELDWSPGVHSQGIGRLFRTGQTETVLPYFLHSAEGADPPMLDALNLKTMQAQPIVNPDVDMLAPAVDTTDRVRALAAAVLGEDLATLDFPT